MFERSYGSFTRSIHMPAQVHADKAKVNFKDGILVIKVPKTAEAKKKQRKIATDNARQAVVVQKLWPPLHPNNEIPPIS